MALEMPSQMESSWSLVRMEKNPGFRFLVEEEDDLIELEQRKTVSLRESVRRAEWEQREQNRLDRRNRLRAFRGLEPLASLEDDEEDEPAAGSDEKTENTARASAQQHLLRRARHGLLLPEPNRRRTGSVMSTGRAPSV